jgi:sugar phosphate isomerase/epimerase
MHTVPRRGFLARLGAAGVGAGVASVLGPRLHAIQPFHRTGSSRMRLSLAAYSFRQFFKHNNSNTPPSDPNRAIDLFEFVDFCGRHGCAAEVTGYYFPPDVDADYLLRLKRHAHVSGVALSGTAVGNTFTLPVGDKRTQEIATVKRWIDHAAMLGAPHIRVFAGSLPTGMSKGQARALCIGALEETCAYAATRGVFLGLENHGGIVAEPADLLDLIRSVDSPWLGVNLDSGNFHTADPYVDLVRFVPYAVNVQIKVDMQPKGQPKAPADFERLVKMLRDGNYQGYVALEYEAEEDPWTAVPRHLDRLRGLLA